MIDASHIAVAKAVRNKLGEDPEWRHLIDALRIGMEKVEALPALDGDKMSGDVKKSLAVASIRDVVSEELSRLLKAWRGPMKLGWWAYPLLTVLVYPLIHRIGMWTFDQTAPQLVDLIVSASKGEMGINIDPLV